MIMADSFGDNVLGRTGDNPILDRNNGFARVRYTPMVKAHEGAQNGPVLNIGKFVNNDAYVSRDVIAKVIEFPKWIYYMPDPTMYKVMIKSFIEVQTKIDGLQSTITSEFHEQEIGNSGLRQYTFNKNTITPSEVTHNMEMDKVGRPYQNLFVQWQRYGMGDYESGIPLVHLLNPNIQDHLVDMYCMTVLYFEPDIRRRSIEKAWLITNMAPRGSGENTARKEGTTGGQTLSLNISFTGLQDDSLGVYEMAERELKALDRGGLNPMTRRAFREKADADVAATANGYWESAREAKSRRITGAAGY